MAISSKSPEQLFKVINVREGFNVVLVSKDDDDHTVQKHVEDAGFQICAGELKNIVEGHDLKKLKTHGGVPGVADKLTTDASAGIPYDSLYRCREVYGTENFGEGEPRRA